MNPMGKKFISLFIVLSLLTSFGNLFAEERHGAKLLIQTKSGSQIRGELIAVRKNTLQLLSESGADLAIDIDKVEVIVIVKKSKYLQGAGLGLLIGGSGGALFGKIISPSDLNDGLRASLPYFFGMLGAAAGLLIGAITGAISGQSKIILTRGMPDWEIQKTLEKLREKARIPSYK